MRQSNQLTESEARWLDDLRNGYTDVLPVVRDRRSFDARFTDGRWSHEPAPHTQANEPPQPPWTPPRNQSAAAGRLFFTIVFWFALATSLELWWLGTAAGSLNDTAAVLLAVGRITGMVAGFVLLAQILLMSRIGWLERWLGAHTVLIWHRELGGYLLVTVLVHMAATIMGYATGSQIPILGETWMMISADRDMVTATLATALLIAIALMSIRGLRRLMSYEKWYYIHVTSYLVVILAYGHQFTAGRELMEPGFGRIYWTGLHLFVAGCLVWGRLVQPLALNLRHRLKVADVVPQGPDMVSIYISGRHLDRMKVRAGQYFRWRFLTRGRWWQAHPFSLSAAPNSGWLRLTVKAVGDHTGQLRRLNRGARVFAEGPSGVFTADRSVKRRALLIAGGSGIAPIRALLEELPAGTIAIYRARDEQELIFRDEFEWLARERRAYVYYVVGSREEPGPRHLFTARGMRELVPDVSRRDVFLCGPPGLVQASLDVLRRLRVPKRQIHLDPFEF
jgi:predicted ferric reductase